MAVIPKAFEETVPNLFIGTLCSFVNVGINGGFLLSVLAGSYMPDKITDDSSVWRTIVAFPLMF